MSGRAALVGAVLSCVLLAGCGGQGKQELPGQGGEASDPAQTYERQIIDLGITPQYDPAPQMFFLTDGGCCFVDRAAVGEEEEKSYRYEVFWEPDGQKPKSVTRIEGEFLLSVSLDEGSDGEPLISVLTCSADGNRMTMTEYTGEGKELSSFAVEEAYSGIFKHFRRGDGSYLAMAREKLLLIDRDGGTKAQIACPGAQFQGGVAAADGRVYVTYLEKASDQTARLAALSESGTSLAQVGEIAGDGSVLAKYGEQDLIFLCGGGLMVCHTGSGSTEKRIDFSNFSGVFSERMLAVCGTESDVRAISWNSMKSDQPVELHVFRKLTSEEVQEKEQEKAQDPPEEKYDDRGRRIVTLYDPFKMAEYMLGTEIIRNFNMESEDYCLEILEGSPDLEAVLLSDDCPDLVCSMYATDMEKYYRAGYLEDLTPYLEKSQILYPGNLQDFVYDCYGADGKLYAMARYCTVETMLLPQSMAEAAGLGAQDGVADGWNVEEFLDFLEAHPDLKSSNGLTRDMALEYILKGNLERYVDLETGEADFESEEFQRILERIRGMEFPQMRFFTANEQYAMDQSEVFLINFWISSLAQIAEQENIYGEKLVNMGLPCDRDEAAVQYNMVSSLGILQKGGCREGAFAFLEYVMSANSMDFSLDSLKEQHEAGEAVASGFPFAVKSTYATEMEYAKGTRYFALTGINAAGEYETLWDGEYEVTDEQEAFLMELIGSAQKDTDQKRVIRQIVAEEAQGYFEGQKDLASTCKVIQSRVHLFVSENL